MKILWTFFFWGGGHHKIELVEGVISMYFIVFSNLKKVILTPSAGQFQAKVCARCTG